MEPLQPKCFVGAGFCNCLIKHAFKCNFLCAPLLMVEEAQHCLIGVKLHATMAFLLSTMGKSTGEHRMIPYSSLVGWSRRPCDK